MNRPNRSLLPFDYDKTSHIWSASPQRLFRPAGLALWAPPGAVIEPVLISRTAQAVCSFGTIPARFFGMGESFEQLCKKVKEGIEPPHWCDWDTVHPGQVVQITVLFPAGVGSGEGHPPDYARRIGPPDGVEMVMWGHSLQ